MAVVVVDFEDALDADAFLAGEEGAAPLVLVGDFGEGLGFAAGDTFGAVAALGDGTGALGERTAAALDGEAGAGDFGAGAKASGTTLAGLAAAVGVGRTAVSGGEEEDKGICAACSCACAI